MGRRAHKQIITKQSGTSQVALVVENPPASARDLRDTGSIPGSGRSPGEGHGNPLRYSCLGESHGQWSLEDFSPRGCKESETTEELSMHSRTERSAKRNEGRACIQDALGAEMESTGIHAGRLRFGFWRKGCQGAKDFKQKLKRLRWDPKASLFDPF